MIITTIIDTFKGQAQGCFEWVANGEKITIYDSKIGNFVLITEEEYNELNELKGE